MNKIFRKYIAWVILGLSISIAGVSFSYTQSECNALDTSETLCTEIITNGYILTADPFSTPPTINENQMKKASFMTFNIKGGTPRYRVLDMINDDYSPDVIGFQEVNDAGDVIYYNEGLEDDYYMYIHPQLKTERLPIFFKKDRFNLLDGGNWWLSHAEVPTGDMRATWVALQDKENGDEYLVINTHLASQDAYVDEDGEWCLPSPPCPLKAKKDIREIEADKIIYDLLGNVDNRDKIVLLGDMNAAPEDSELKAFFEHPNPDRRFSVNTHQTSSAGAEEFYLDHIYFNRGLFAVYSEVIETYDYSLSSDIGCKIINHDNECNDVSDHFPVYGEIVTSEYLLPRIIPVMGFVLH